MPEKKTSLSAGAPQVRGRFLLPSLAISYSAVWPSAVLMGLLLLDVARSFGLPVGVAGWIPAVNFLVTAVSAILMGAWSVRFNHKSLLLLGLFLVNVDPPWAAPWL